METVGRTLTSRRASALESGTAVDVNNPLFSSTPLASSSFASRNKWYIAGTVLLVSCAAIGGIVYYNNAPVGSSEPSLEPLAETSSWLEVDLNASYDSYSELAVTKKNKVIGYLENWGKLPSLQVDTTCPFLVQYIHTY